MAANPVVPGLWQVPISFVNAYILEGDDGLVLIDTGFAGSADKIENAVRSIARDPREIRQILPTHCHGDHAGSLAELKRRTGATVSMHAEDAAMVRAGQARRRFLVSPGLINGIVGRLIAWLAPAAIEPAEVEHEIGDGETIPGAGGLRAIHVPGHSAGQLAFLWPRHGGVLIVADAAANAFGLNFSPVYEDLDEGRRSLAKLAALDFEVACFGHGGPIKTGAAVRFRRHWPPAPAMTPSTT
jgi:glyoxylase-like metal-dependent hydrolase (beta-lactamase superfamily II)